MVRCLLPFNERRLIIIIRGFKVQYYSPLCRQIIFLATFFLLTLLSLPSFAENTPSNAIKLFYQLVSKQQCIEAIKIRPDYTLERCKKITKAHIHKVTTELSDNKNAVVLLELDSFVNKKKNYFFGYVKLTKKKGKWLIIGPFRNREDYWLDEYVNAYIPEGIKGLSVEEKQRKLTPPPVEKFESKRVPTPIEEKTAKQQPNTAAKTSIEKNTVKVDIKKEAEKSPPPGDSIDADEFTEPTIKLHQTHTKKTTSPNTIIQKSTTPEADKFIFGEHAIEGNYTSLLRKIRKNFPKEAISNILLIDQSRNTIYVYNNVDLLLAFFPILSSDNSNFPSGLYRLNSDNSLESTHQETQTIILDRIQKIIPSELGVHSKQRKEQYYIRNLFDTDKSRSLQLSPIDNNKLQQLILPSTIAYKGQ